MVRVSTSHREGHEVTQSSQTIDHAPRRDRFTVGIFSPIAPARLVSAPTATQSPANAAPSGYQPPANDTQSLVPQGTTTADSAIAKHHRPEPAPIADLGRAIKAGGEGVEASAQSQSSQYIPPRRKFPHCPRP
jgi:hypothetical protein